MQNGRVGSKGSTIIRWIAAVSVAVLLAFGAQAQGPVKVPAAEAAKLLIQPAASPVNPLKAAHVTGVVHLDIVVDAKGAVTDIKDLDNTPMDNHSAKGILVQAAMDAVHQYHYHPYLVKGQPAAMRTTVDVVFNR
jgi:outer membrane biosynthesis protein TonB